MEYRRELVSATRELTFSAEWPGKIHREGHFETIVGENGGAYCADVWKKSTLDQRVFEH